MAKGLRLAKGLTLPEDFATQGTAIIGVRGSGKSNTEVRFAELLHAAGIPFVAVDPKGDWHGIRVAGSGPGLPVPVFGGLYGDFPLDEHLGARIADLLVNENLSAVLDVSLLSKTSALPKFLTAFCNQLMDRHQREPHVRTVILEEAHRYIPQMVTAKTAALKEAAASLLLEGRAFGLGCWACTQRPARLHNDVLEEVDTAVIHRLGVTATADLKRVREWVKHEDLGPEVSESLTKLQNGEAWVLSPVALGIVQRVQIDRRTTADTGATPLVGAKRRTVSTMATIDAPAITAALADAIDKAVADDPKTLRARIAQLEKELRERPAAEPIIQEVTVAYIPPQVVTAAEDLRRAVVDLLGGEVSKLEAAVSVQPAEWTEVVKPLARPPAGANTVRLPAPRPQADPQGTLNKAERAFLTVLAQHGAIPRAQLALLAGYSVKSRHVDNVLGGLRTRGLVNAGMPVDITQAGLDELGSPDALPTGAALRDYWLTHPRVTKAAAAFLDVLFSKYPDPISRAQLAEAAGYSVASRHVDNTLGSLRTMGLAVGKGDAITAAPDLMTN